MLGFVGVVLFLLVSSFFGGGGGCWFFWGCMVYRPSLFLGGAVNRLGLFLLVRVGVTLFFSNPLPVWLVLAAFNG